MHFQRVSVVQNYENCCICQQKIVKVCWTDQCAFCFFYWCKWLDNRFWYFDKSFINNLFSISVYMVEHWSVLLPTFTHTPTDVSLTLCEIWFLMSKSNTKKLFWKAVEQKLMRVEIKINKVSFRNQTIDWKYCWKQYLILNNCWLECKFLYLLIFFVINSHLPVSSITERFSQLNSALKKWINYSFPSFFFL